MEREALYHKTVNILFDAYFNDTLQHGNCYACAVGNIVAANMGLSFCLSPKRSVSHENLRLHWKGENNWYAEGLLPDRDSKYWVEAISLGHVSTEKLKGGTLEQINATGYSPLDLAKIECAFENAREFGVPTEENMFNGLCAVLEALKEIHHVTDEDLLTSNQSRFAAHYETRKITA